MSDYPTEQQTTMRSERCMTSHVRATLLLRFLSCSDFSCSKRACGIGQLVRLWHLVLGAYLRERATCGLVWDILETM